MTAVATRAALPTIALFGIPLAVTDYAEVLGLVKEWLTSERDASLTMDASNTMTLAGSCVDSRLRSSALQLDLVLPDGRPLVWFMNRRGAGLADVVSGPHLVPKILGALTRTTRIAVIGGQPDEHRAIVLLGARRFPLADFALLQEIPPGPINERLVDRCIERIDASGAEIVFVLLGVPRQYYWIALAKPKLGGRVCVGVGGAFNFMTGRYSYAPRWMQRTGLWWLHRALSEPRRLGPRYLKYNTLFLWFLLTREVLPSRRRRGRRGVGPAGA
jgi:N-acetylglucosaminyldiphosphoundecaprenol N-acetyl-beta-D-mannosaminyltransferase